MGRWTAASRACSSAVACCAKAAAKALLGSQIQPSVVGLEFGCLRVWGIAVENVGDGFALVGRQRGHIDQCLDARVTGRADDAAGVGVAGQHDRPFGSVDGPDDRVHVIVE